jgi:cell pole-organizing protein PopZ
MSNPAPKEPSMEEILSSIRQIIADDDEGGRRSAAPTGPQAVPPPAAAASRPAPAEAGTAPVPSPAASPPPESKAAEPLPLSAEQIVPAGPSADDDDETLDFTADLAAEVAGAGDDHEDAVTVALDEDEEPLGYREANLVEGDDITFDSDADAGAEPAAASPVTPAPAPRSQPMPPRTTAPVGRTAPMPDPRLSADLAEHLLGPATDAAVKHAFSRLGAMPVGAPGVTVEQMMREMLRPMLKDWLDEHLPAVVERMVEREIARISRGVD